MLPRLEILTMMDLLMLKTAGSMSRLRQDILSIVDPLEVHRYLGAGAGQIVDIEQFLLEKKMVSL